MGGEDECYIANQLAHRSLEMIHRHYGRVLPDKNNPQNYKLRNKWDSFEEVENKDSDK